MMIVHLYMSAPSDGTGKLPRVNPGRCPLSDGITFPWDLHTQDQGRWVKRWIDGCFALNISLCLRTTIS